MRSQVIRRSRSLLSTSTRHNQTLLLAERPSRLPRKEQRPSRTWKRLASSTKIPSAEGEKALSAAAPPASPNPPTEEPEKIEPEKPKRTRTRITAAKDSDSPQLPLRLDILWTPESDMSDKNLSHSLPPPEIFQEALNNLYLTLHPQAQHRAIHSSPAGAPVEPTLALYCPIEGGEYVIDETVRELARKTDSEVVVIDSVQLAAGEWGHFGKAANVFQLSHNPLHFSHSNQVFRSTNGPVMVEEDDDGEPTVGIPQQTTFHVMVPAGRGRSLLSPSTSGNSTQSKLKSFFEELINVSGRSSSTEKSAPGKSRIIYIRDFPTLAPSSATWYPPLLSAVRQRRAGPISRPSSPAANPMTIVFGMTPSIIPPRTVSPGPVPPGLVTLLTNQNQSPSAARRRSGKSDWGEDEVADKEREKRLREKLRKWEKGDAALYDELPTLAVEEDNDHNGRSRSGVVVIGSPNGMSSLPPFLESAMAGRSENRSGSSDSDGSRFFRTSVLVPYIRSPEEERACRVARRREINELTMKMGVGAVGGVLEGVPQLGEEITSPARGSESTLESADNHRPQMWDEWGKRVEDWSTVRQIADRAVGSMVAANSVQTNAEKSHLASTAVPWSAIHRAWGAQWSSRDLRKAWMKESNIKIVREQEEKDDDDKGNEDVEDESADELLERIKQDPELEQHEQRLLPCIVDTASMTTSFSQVHLPPHTIDSVRTIVSLPLLHPAAFQQGILKEHGMTGCLLFGPPGTGKTLVVRALAKEAGCRMMAISPSDVMDMYVGEGEKLVKAVFSLARRLSPCVVFLDEIDALFGARMSARESGGAFAHRGVITEFMQEMDGLKSSKDDRVIVIGATNRPFDLDDAVLRRLPRRLLVDLPGEKEREEILKILLRDEILAPDLDLHVLAKKTAGFSGSDLKHLCVSAALDAVKERVVVPWRLNTIQPYNLTNTTSASDNSSTSESLAHPATQTPDPSDMPSLFDVSTAKPGQHIRTLTSQHFNKALKEITPSSSESLGSLAALRKWNDEFGEGRKRNKEQVWGKDRFGFTNRIDKPQEEEGRVASIGVPSNSTTGAKK